ncbi:RraA family protein [Novosphingobium sp.]|uniref:RraA family protein n=1 Tax=Novosphingobium sp. TaxID=1874826 RepID=UPI0028AEBA14|nr:RraA family protein [Novosphingobium sp.]
MTQTSGSPITEAVRGDDDLVEQFTRTSTSIISDNLSRLPGGNGVRPFHRIEGVMAGRALTVRVPAGDNLFIHKALELIVPGTVLVVDGGGDTARALMGEIMATIAEVRGAAGVIIDGAIRDAGTIGRSSFPIFARTANHRGPYKHGPGEIGVPVSIGGMVVRTGDIIVGDEDGVVAFDPAIAADLYAACLKTEAMEVEMIASIRAGTYKGAYAAH